jgi:hypothetical protein
MRKEVGGNMVRPERFELEAFCGREAERQRRPGDRSRNPERSSRRISVENTFGEYGAP